MSSLSQLFPSSGGGGGVGAIKRVEYLLVGGGGAARTAPAANYGGGGGAGRVVHSNENIVVTGITTWTINIGYGGGATDNPNYVAGPTPLTTDIHNGTPSSITDQDSIIIATANGGGRGYINLGGGPTVGSAGADSRSNPPGVNDAPSPIVRAGSFGNGEYLFYYDLGNPSGFRASSPIGDYAGGGGGALSAGDFDPVNAGGGFGGTVIYPDSREVNATQNNKGGRGYYSEITGTGVTYGQGGDGTPLDPTGIGVTQPFDIGWGASSGASSTLSNVAFGGSPGVCVVRWRSPLGDAASVTGNDPTLPSTVNPGWYTYRFTTTSTSAGIGTISF